MPVVVQIGSQWLEAANRGPVRGAWPLGNLRGINRLKIRPGLAVKLHLNKAEVEKMTRRVTTATLAALLLTGGMVFGSNGNQAAPAAQNPIQREVRHELLTLSRYTVFDNIEYRVNGTEVSLFGQVTQPVLKDDATTAMRSIPGVTKVDNQIEVLPVSPMDWSIRRAEFRAIYSDPSLNRYAIQAIPSIHIIVKNGHVTLMGAVSTQMDKNLAGIRANSVPNVFSVTNDIQVTNGI